VPLSCSGDNVLSSRAEVVVTVVNKAMPIFDEAFYSASVSENMQPFTAILTVSARSPMGNALVYSIVQGDDYGEFSVDFNIGRFSIYSYWYCLVCVLCFSCAASLCCRQQFEIYCCKCC